MAPHDPPTQLTPCYIPARVLLNDAVVDVTLTRLGATRAQLSGDIPLDAGQGARLELNRPTDGRRIRVEFQVAKVHREGAQWGWKPAFHLDLDERLDECSPLTEEHVPVYPRAGSPPPPLPTEDPDDPPAGTGSGAEAEPSLPPGSWIGAVFDAVSAADDERASGDDDRGDEPPPSWATAPTDAAEGRVGESPVATGEAPAEESAVDTELAPMPPWELNDLTTPPPMEALIIRDDEGVEAPVDGVPRRPSAGTPWDSEDEEVSRSGRGIRILAEAPATYHSAGQERFGTVQDFDSQGMFLAIAPGDPVPPMGAVVRVKYAVPQPDGPRSVRFTAEVRWGHGDNDPGAQGRGMGLLIMDFPTPAERRAYETHVTALLSGDD